MTRVTFGDRNVTPGVYFERATPQAEAGVRLTARAHLHTDIAGFVGLAERGPLHTPVRLTSWREFQATFGAFLPFANLAYAVRAFFENGGQVCHVVRIADAEEARVAAVIAPAAGAPDAGAPDAAGQGAYLIEAASPGTWGRELAVSIQPASLATTQHVPIAGLPPGQLAVASVTGFERGSWVRLTQGGAPHPEVRQIASVDVARAPSGSAGVLTFDPLSPETGATGMRPEDREHLISIQSLEFDLVVWQENQVVERFENLAPDDAHSRYAPRLVNASDVGSQFIRLARGSGSGLPATPWRGALTGGANGLASLDLRDFTGAPGDDRRYGLATLALVDEVSLLAIPDLSVRRFEQQPLRRRPRQTIDPCALDTPVLRITVSGRVVTAGDAGDAESETPLPNVQVQANDGLAVDRPKVTSTGPDGSFSLPDLLPGNIELIFSREGYATSASRVATSGGATGGDIGIVRLAALDLPPPLAEPDVYAAQAAMIGQCEALRDRFALLDPPLTVQGTHPSVDALQAWRARFDTAFAALYYPWLVVRDPLDPSAPVGRLVPPSGHVAGVYAATDLAEGVFRPPANRALVFVEDVAVPVDERVQGVLNPKGINVIRAFPGRGIRVYGARTLSSASAWRFVNVRRLMSMIEETLYQRLQWAVFEPNDLSLRMGLRLSITSFLDGLWRQGAFAGAVAEAAYSVRCDESITPPAAQAEGKVIAEVAVAPTVPYEFLVLRLGLTRDELRISEV